jgi:hypothetical protein
LPRLIDPELGFLLKVLPKTEGEAGDPEDDGDNGALPCTGIALERRVFIDADIFDL